MFRHFWCLITHVPFFFFCRRLSRGLVRHPRHHLLNNELALGTWPLRHDFIDHTMKCRSSLTGSLWLWQVLSFMTLVRHTSTLFTSGFRLTTMRLSRRFRVGGLLFGCESGRSPRKALPGPRSSASTTTPWSCSALGALHRSRPVLGELARHTPQSRRFLGVWRFFVI